MIYKVKRKNDTVTVALVKNKCDNTYSYINLTKQHICPCRFKTIEDALNDMNEQDNVICYEKINYKEEINNG